MSTIFGNAMQSFKFGESSTSDVVLVVENNEFHVHKRLLSARSPFFQALFFADFAEKNLDRIPIKEADPVAFRRLMDMLYNGRIEDDKQFLHCPDSWSCSDKTSILKLWNDCRSLLNLADRIDTLPYILNTFQLLLRTNECTMHGASSKTGCRRGAVKLMIALIYKMEDYKKESVVNRVAVSYALDILERAIGGGVAELIASDFTWLLRRA